jgi:uncharacterized protein (TIGR02646 family)
MIRIETAPILTHPQFANLERKSAIARERLLQPGYAGPREKFEPRIWVGYKPLLKAASHGKCAYCENAIPELILGDVEMYRPKSIYWWLAYDWSNLLYVCQVCNRAYKGDRFPLEDNFPPAKNPGDELTERPLLLHPYIDNPEEHLTFRADDNLKAVQIIGLTERGRGTIVTLGLNREELQLQRYSTWANIKLLLSLGTIENGKISKAVVGSLADSAPYAGAIRSLFHSEVEKLGLYPGADSLLGLLPSTTPKVSSDALAKADRETIAFRKSLSAYSVENPSKDDLEKFNFGVKRIERIEVKNLRGIRTASLTLSANADQESWLMLIGENGVGKSTLLKGVALALMGQHRANSFGLKGPDFVSHGAKERSGSVTVHLNAIGPVTLRFNMDSEAFSVEPPEPKVPLLAYGTTRLLPHEVQESALDHRNIRVNNLFIPTTPLSDAEDWLRGTWNTDREAFDSIGRAICRLLMLKETNLPRLGARGVELKLEDGWRILRDLSDGYKAMLALVVDIAIGTTGTRQKPEEAVGIVLLDEIELHLHPQWKISIVDRFRRAFPRLSFLVTTHDPLCLKGLRENEIVALRRGPRGKITVTTILPSVETLKTDDILMSELFDLSSSRSTSMSVSVAQYSRLLEKGERTPQEEMAFQRLQSEISAIFAGAITPMQRKVERALTAVMEQLRNGKSGQQLTKDVVAEIRRQVKYVDRNHDSQ